MLRCGYSYPEPEAAACIPKTQREKNKGEEEEKGGEAKKGGEEKRVREAGEVGGAISPPRVSLRFLSLLRDSLSPSLFETSSRQKFAYVRG
jgi:hypothetical protein